MIEQLLASLDEELKHSEREKAPFFSTFLLTCSFEEVSVSCSLRRNEEGPFGTVSFTLFLQSISSKDL
jgi:hypothetical protein